MPSSPGDPQALLDTLILIKRPSYKLFLFLWLITSCQVSVSLQGQS